METLSRGKWSSPGAIAVPKRRVIFGNSLTRTELLRPHRKGQASYKDNCPTTGGKQALDAANLREMQRPPSRKRFVLGRASLRVVIVRCHPERSFLPRSGDRVRKGRNSVGKVGAPRVLQSQFRDEVPNFSRFDNPDPVTAIQHERTHRNAARKSQKPTVGVHRPFQRERQLSQPDDPNPISAMARETDSTVRRNETSPFHDDNQSTPNETNSL